jgi:hypothetical protein
MEKQAEGGGAGILKRPGHPDLTGCAKREPDAECLAGDAGATRDAHVGILGKLVDCPCH